VVSLVDFQNYLRTQIGSTTTINVIICTYGEDEANGPMGNIMVSCYQNTLYVDAHLQILEI